MANQIFLGDIQKLTFQSVIAKIPSYTGSNKIPFLQPRLVFEFVSKSNASIYRYIFFNYSKNDDSEYKFNYVKENSNSTVNIYLFTKALVQRNDIELLDIEEKLNT
ncbi:MAG: hypothetical protein WCT85_01270 [Parachlamydiales bacterium]|jgi:hypothetical protein